MHLKKCTLFLSFCTVFTPKRQNSPPFERKRRDREKEIFLSHLCGFPVARGCTSSSEISHRQPRTHFFCDGTFRNRARVACFFPRFHIGDHGRVFLLRRDFSRSGKGGVLFSRFHIDSHGRVFLLRRDFSRSGKGGVFFSEISHRQPRTRFSFAARLFTIE